MKALLVYNHHSGKEKITKKIDYIQKRLSEKYECSLYCPKDDELIKDYIINLNTKYDIFISIGGDGTLHSLISGLINLNYNYLVGIIPFGTINDMANGYKISKNIDKAINIILNLENIKKHKIYKINDDIMVYSFAMGMLTSTSFIKKKRLGILSYYFNALKLFIKDKGINIKLKIKNEIIDKNIKCIIITDTYRLAGYKIKKTNKLRIGIINCPKLLFPFKLWLFFIKNNKKELIESNNIEIESNSLKYNCDGEGFDMPSNIKISYYKSINLITNRKE